MGRFTTYAVINEETNEVVSQLLQDMAGGQITKRNGLVMGIVENDKVTSRIKVRLSSTKGDIEKITSIMDPEPAIRNFVDYDKCDLVQILD